MDVADPDATLKDFRHGLVGNAHPVVLDLDLQPPLSDGAAQPNRAAADLRAQAVLDGILHDRLQQHAGHERAQCVFLDFLHDPELVSKAHLLDTQIVVNEGNLFPQAGKSVLLAQEASQNGGQLEDDQSRCFTVTADE